MQFYLFVSHKYPLCLTVVLETYSIKFCLCVGGNFGYCYIVQSILYLLTNDFGNSFLNLLVLAHALSTEWQPCITYYSSPCRHDPV